MINKQPKFLITNQISYYEPKQSKMNSNLSWKTKIKHYKPKKQGIANQNKAKLVEIWHYKQNEAKQTKTKHYKPEQGRMNHEKLLTL